MGNFRIPIITLPSVALGVMMLDRYKWKAASENLTPEKIIVKKKNETEKMKCLWE